MAWFRRQEQRSQSYSISDPALALFLGGSLNYSGEVVSETTALGLSGFWRANAVISGTIASLPLHTIRDADDGTRTRIPSFLDDPGQEVDGAPTAVEWKETVVTHLVMHGNAFLAHVYNAGGGLIGLWPIHPCGVEVIYDENAIGRRLYKVSQIDGTHKIFSVLDMTHIPGLCVDGLRGLSLISMARNGLGIAIAADKASARMFSSGALLNGLVTSEEDLTGDEAKEIQASITNNMSGADNAGAIRVINRKLKYTAMSMTAADAQWLESRQFEIEEIARYTGVPPHLLMQTSKQTSWGTGVAEQNRGLARYTLMPFTTRIEQRLSRLRPRPQFAEFDFAGLVAPTPEEEITLLIAQVAGGLITVNEARHIRNMDPIEGGDVLNVPNGMGAAALLKPPTPVPSEVPA